LSFSTARLLSLSTLALFWAAAAFAQQSFNISGELVADPPRDFNRFTVEVIASSSHSAAARAFVTTGGRFELRNLAAGTYRLQVLDSAGSVVIQETLVPSPLTANVRFTVPNNPGKSTAITGVIGAAELNHKTSRKAVKEMLLAETYKNSGDHLKAIEHLKTAVEIDPKSVEAHTNLGVEYARTGHYRAAREEFTATMDLGLRGSQQYCNLAIAALGLNETETAESNVRSALALDSRSPQANYLMGKILAERPERSADAIRYLRLAAPEMPAVNFVLAQTYIRAGDNRNAIEALKLYEQTAPPSVKPKVEEVIKSLR
jgi:tetratricopeptide (TPR) repeat protein